MKRFPVSTPDKRPLWQTFLAPMLLVSLGLHGAFLFLPVASDEVPIPPPDPEQDNIAITRIPPPAPETAVPPQARGTQPTSVAVAAQRPAVTRMVGQPVQPTRASTIPGQRAVTQRAQSTGNRTQSSTRTSSRTRQTTTPTVNNPRQQQELPQSAPLDEEPGSTETAGVAIANSSPPPLDPQVREQFLAYARSIQLPPGVLERVTAHIEQYRYSEENLFPRLGRENRQTWMDALRMEFEDPTLEHQDLEDPLSLTHARRVCMEPAPQAAQFGAVVSPEGTLQEAPILLKSTGYPYLNDLVAEQVRTHEFPASGQLMAYVVEVTVDVDYGGRPCFNPYPASTDTADADN